MSYARLARPNQRRLPAGRVLRPAAALPLHPAETFFGATRPEEGHTPGAPDAPLEPERSAGSRTTALLRRCARLIVADWRMVRWAPASGERAIATLGSVEIRRTTAARVAQTCVKGDAAQARATALCRLAKYVDGDNVGAVSMLVERPVMQLQIEPHRWLVGVRLSSEGNPRSAPVPLAPKVRVVAWEPETLAVLRMDGRPSHDLISFGDAIIRDAIGRGEWTAIGSARIRLRAFRCFPWLAGGFEVAVPVSPRIPNTPR